MRYLLKSLYAKVIELFTNIGNKQYKPYNNPIIIYMINDKNIV